MFVFECHLSGKVKVFSRTYKVSRFKCKISENIIIFELFKNLKETTSRLLSSKMTMLLFKVH